MGCCCSSKKEVTEPVSLNTDNLDKKPEPKAKKELNISELIRKYASFVMEWIVQENHEEICKIIKEGFSPDIIFDAGGYNSTILILTIAFKKDELTHKVLSFKQNIDITVKPNNDSAIMMAISHKNVSVLEALIKKGASKSIMGPEGKSLLELANK